jgi:copper chaperone CopZ
MRSILLLVFIVGLTAGCQKKGMVDENAVPMEQIEAAAAQSNETLEPNTAVMYVYGMGCPQCAYNIDMQLLKLKGVKEVKVDMGTGKVTAHLNPENPATEAQLTRAIRNTGFTLVKMQIAE